MFIAKKHLSRRTFLRGAGVTLALPLLESMVPAGTALAQTAAAPRSRLGCIYIPHGATMDKWTPAGEGRGFEFSEILQPLEPFRDRVCVVSDLAHAPVAPWSGEDTGGAENHVRAAAVFLSGAHPVEEERGLRRHDRRSARGAARRPGHAAALDRAVDRAARTWLRRRRFHLRVSQHAVVEIGDAAAADGEQSADRVRAAVRRRQHRGAAPGTAQQARSLLDSIRGQVPALEKELPAADRAAAAATTSMRCAKSSAACKQVDATLSARSRAAGCAGRRPGRLRGAPEVAVRPAGARLQGRDHAHLDADAGAREQQRRVSRHRHARRVPQRLAPLERAKNKDQFAVINRYHVKLLAYFLERLQRDAGRRRHAARSLDGALRQQPERRQRAQLRPAADRAGRRGVRSAAGRTASAPCAADADVEPAARDAAQDGRARREDRRQHRSR